MSRIAVLLAMLALLLIPAPGRAAFHIAVIDELMSGAGGNSNIQYVEIRPLIASNNNVCHTRLTVFKCMADGGGFQVLIDNLGGAGAMQPCVPNGTAGARWIMASPDAATFLAASGITPDVTWNNGTTGNIPTACGMVCWGAPGSFLPPTDPSTWMAGVPTNYVDCVAYGAYDGTAEPFGNPAATDTPGGGTFSLTRMGDTMFSNNFQLACPSPTSNPAQATGNFGACTPPPTTTTSSTSTTTTLPGTGPSKCSSKEIAAAGKKAGGKAKCWSKATKKALPVDSACLGKAETKFSDAYTKAQGKGDCVNSTAAGTIETKVDNFITDLVTEIDGGTGTPTASKCSSKELSAASKKAGKVLKCYAKAAGKGIPLDTTCTGGATTKFGASWAKATAATDCTTTVSQGDIETKIDNFAADVNAELTGP
jgi:hypothetical protein